MGVFAGPKVVEDGLVLALDPGNVFKSVDSTSNNFLQNGSFAGGLGVTYESGSNPTNTIIELENPGDSNYVLRQNGSNTEYQMNIDGGAQGTLLASTQYVMSGWYATSDDYNGGDTMFHARAFSSGGAHNATGNGIGTLLYSVEVGGLTWEYRYQTISTPSDYNGGFDWYMGYGTTNTAGYRYYTGLKVEEGSFPSLLDLSRNGNDAKIINGTSYNSANLGVLTFDGTNDYISTGKVIIPRTGEFHIEGWCYLNQTNATCMFVSQYNNASDPGRFLCFFANDGSIRMHDGGGVMTGTTPSYSANQWFYVAFQRDSSNLCNIFVNGVKETSGATRTTTLENTNTIIATRGSLQSGTYYNGRMSNVRIYNRALTASEIQQNFNALRGRFGI